MKPLTAAQKDVLLKLLAGQHLSLNGYHTFAGDPKGVVFWPRRPGQAIGTMVFAKTIGALIASGLIDHHSRYAGPDQQVYTRAAWAKVLDRCLAHNEPIPALHHEAWAVLTENGRLLALSVAARQRRPKYGVR